MESQALPCSCPKRFYCEGCDAQHRDRKCPRTVLDEIAEAVEFKNKSIKRLISEILASAEARHTWSSSIEHHIRCRIDELADRFGNLGLSRRSLRRLVAREDRRRLRRNYRRGQFDR